MIKMGDLNRQQICAALSVSESTIRRLEQRGLPYTAIGVKSKRYDLAECKEWLRANPPGPTGMINSPNIAGISDAAKEYTAASAKARRRVVPS